MSQEPNESQQKGFSIRVSSEFMAQNRTDATSSIATAAQSVNEFVTLMG